MKSEVKRRVCLWGVQTMSARLWNQISPDRVRRSGPNARTKVGTLWIPAAELLWFSVSSFGKWRE